MTDPRDEATALFDSLSIRQWRSAFGVIDESSDVEKIRAALTRARQEGLGDIPSYPGCTFKVSDERDKETDQYTVYLYTGNHCNGALADFYERKAALWYAAILAIRAKAEAA